MRPTFPCALLILALVIGAQPTVLIAASFGKNPVICPRFAVGSNYSDPPYIFGQNGTLQASLNYETSFDQNDNKLYCYLTPEGLHSPILRINPGDHLKIIFTNNLPKDTGATKKAMHKTCGNSLMTIRSTNLHFHGTYTSPECHQDESIKTIINSGDTFTYDLYFPQNHPPGIYAYHPHFHGLADKAVLGGASGAIIVEGIQNFQPSVAGLPEKILLLRDSPVSSPIGPNIPENDVSLNYIPIVYPSYTPPIFPIKPLESQFWRIVNAGADTIFNLQLLYDGIAQPLQIIAIDGIPLDNQTPKIVYTIELGPLARAEFIIAGPSQSITDAKLVTLNIDNGPDGDSAPYRPLAQLVADSKALEAAYRIPKISAQFVKGFNKASVLASSTPSITRKLYFSQKSSNPNEPEAPSDFFITMNYIPLNRLS